jgi:protease I
MKGILGILTGLLLLTATMVALAVAGQVPNEEASVRATVEIYLHGLKFNHVESFRRAFYPEAKLFFVRKNGELGQLTQEQWYKGFAANAGKEEQGELRIAAVDITGKAASVKVIETYPDSTYTDYVSLLKLGGEWKIVNKVFTFEKRAS